MMMTTITPFHDLVLVCITHFFCERLLFFVSDLTGSDRAVQVFLSWDSSRTVFVI